MKWLALVSFLSVSLSCSVENDAETIIKLSIAAHRSDILNHAIIKFTFRGKQFWIERNNGLFHYQRIYSDSLGQTVTEGITNDSTYKTINGIPQMLSEKQKSSTETAVNSVVYFSLLPLPLLDPAVQPTYLELVSVDERTFHKILVTFKKEGGGKDYEDQFVYWIDSDNYRMKYFAYTFHTNGGGSRFRTVSEYSTVDSVLFTQQINYKSTDSTLSIQDFDSAFEQNNLTEVSAVTIENIKVVRLK